MSQRQEEGARKDRLPRVTWVLPLFLLMVFVILSTIASRISPEQLKKQLLEAWGVSEAKIQDISLEGPGGWPLSIKALQPRPPHKHPLPPRFSVLDTGFDLIFPHFGDGVIPGSTRNFQTTWILYNFSEQDLTGSMEIYDDAGNLQEVTVNGTSANTFNFSLKVRESKRFTTAGTGSIKMGWAHIHSDQPTSGTSSFGIFDAQGAVVTDVGVAAAEVGAEFTIFADTMSGSNTGVAVVNPSDTETVTLDFELYDPEGTMVTIESRQLLAREHLALFLTELYPNLAGINEFEGSLLIRSVAAQAASAESEGTQGATAGQPFAGITLRATGDTLTSLPMVPPPQDPEVTKLAFSHVGDGVAGSLAITTTAIIFNNTGQAATGMIEFFNSDATPMQVTIGSQTDSSFDFSLNPKGVVRMITDGTGSLRVGWARVSMDQPLNGSAIFQIFETGGSAAGLRTPLGEANLVTEAGVNSTALYQHAFVIVDNTGVFNTGLALVYPLLPDDPDEETRIQLFLWGGKDKFVGSKDILLKSLQHNALFIDQLFAGAPLLKDEFEGYLRISSPREFFAPLALRQAGAKLTSTPILVGTHAFAPVSILQFAQNLAGTSPAVQWTLHQNADDLVMEKVKISARQLGLNTDNIEVGDRIAFGFLPENTHSGVFEFIAKKKGSLEFDAVAADSEGLFVLGSGKLDGSPTGGLTFELTLLNKEPFTDVFDDGDQIYFLPAGLITAPAGAVTVTVTTEFTSVSRDPNKNLPLLRRTTQDITFAAPDSSKANIENIVPEFLVPNETLVLQGTNLGSTPRVLFSLSDGTMTERKGFEDGEGNLRVGVPAGFDGQIKADNGSGEGNTYRSSVLFGPTFEAGVIAENGPTAQGAGINPGFFFRFKQPIEQFFMTEFQVEMFGVDADLSTLQPEAEVGDTSITGLSSRSYS